MRGMTSDGKNLAARGRTPKLEAGLLVMIAGYAYAGAAAFSFKCGNRSVSNEPK